MSENKRVTIPFLEKVLKPIVDLVKTKADKNSVYTKEDLAKVATSGSYTDLSDVPVPDATLTKEGAAADAKAVGDALVKSVADWNEADETSLAFIKNKPTEETEDDALEMLTEMGILDPIQDEENNILTDEDGNIFTIE